MLDPAIVLPPAPGDGFSPGYSTAGFDAPASLTNSKKFSDSN